MRIGIIGAGQLGRMMALAGIPLGLEFSMYDRRRDVPGAAVAEIVTGRFDDTRKLARFARGVDVVTFDWENVPVDRRARSRASGRCGRRRARSRSRRTGCPRSGSSSALPSRSRPTPR